MGILLFVSGSSIFILISKNVSPPTFVYFAVSIPFFVWSMMQFTDQIATAGTFMSVMGSFFFLLLEGGSGNKAILPFVTMGLSLGIYLISTRLSLKQKFQHWQRNLTFLMILSLLTVYLSGNYQVVRALSIKLMDFKLTPDKDIPFAFAFVFYFLTLFIPILYIVTGVKRRLPLFIRMGMLTTLLSILTFKYAFWPGHNAFFLTSLGALLTASAAVLIHFLKTAENGFIYKNLFDVESALNLKAFLLSQFVGNTATEIDDDVTFGCGMSGGAEAWSKY